MGRRRGKFDVWALLKKVYGETLKRLSFPKKFRIAQNERFKAILARKLCVSNGLLKLYLAENDCGYPRLGVSVGKACGNAVVRNRLKRLLREAFRQSRHRIPAGFDYLLMISPRWPKKLDKPADFNRAVKQLKLEQVTSSLLTLAGKAARKVK